jgi:hypothetical protein
MNKGICVLTAYSLLGLSVHSNARANEYVHFRRLVASGSNIICDFEQSSSHSTISSSWVWFLSRLSRRASSLLIVAWSSSSHGRIQAWKRDLEGCSIQKFWAGWKLWQSLARWQSHAHHFQLLYMSLLKSKQSNTKIWLLLLQPIAILNLTPTSSAYR